MIESRRTPTFLGSGPRKTYAFGSRTELVLLSTRTMRRPNPFAMSAVSGFSARNHRAGASGAPGTPPCMGEHRNGTANTSDDRGGDSDFVAAGRNLIVIGGDTGR